MPGEALSVPVAPDAPTDAPDAATRRDAIRKAELEAALAATPDSAALRGEYWQHLQQIAGTRTGLAWALLPEVGHPLYFRCGTTDLNNLLQVFRDGACAFALRATPLRVLVLGAYAGYSAVALARRFPRAQLVCVEPMADNLRLLSLNTTPYRRIRVIEAAAWHTATRLATGPRHWGDWAPRVLAEGTATERTIAGLAVADILRGAGWDQADLIVADIIGAEREVFADPFAPWLGRLDTAIVTIHEEVAARSAQVVSGCFDPALFECTPQGRQLLFERRAPLRVLPPTPAELSLLSAEPRWQPLGLRHVARTSWGFFIFDGDCCQVHPNGVGQPPAQLMLTCRIAGHTMFSSGLLHAGRAAAPITFTVTVITETGAVVAQAARTLAAQEQARLTLPLGGISGDHRIILQTEMAEGSPNNANGWARWLGPKVS